MILQLGHFFNSVNKKSRMFFKYDDTLEDLNMNFDLVVCEENIIYEL